jgi:hypothetical protein
MVDVFSAQAVLAVLQFTNHYRSTGLFGTSAEELDFGTGE